MDTHDEGFLTRWSRRKADVREGRAAPPEPEAEPSAAPAPLPAPVAAPPAPAVEAPPPPTLADVAALTRDADFTRFVAPGVDEGVKRAALKKLFSDPHFNVMDGLDTYIDDYNKPDPLPASMLRKMAQSKFLGLFQEEEEQAAASPGSPADENPDLRLQPDDAAGRPGADESAAGEPRRDGPAA